MRMKENGQGQVKRVQLGNILKPPPAAEKQRGGRFDLETRAAAGQREVTPHQEVVKVDWRPEGSKMLPVQCLCFPNEGTDPR